MDADRGLTLALAGDTMLGRGVAERIEQAGPHGLFDPEVVAAARRADLFVLNLECAISERGSRWTDPAKPFFFRAPPAAVEVLADLGVGCVTLANNHALDYGYDALIDTRRLLTEAGIAVVGAGADRDEARAPCVLDVKGRRVGVVGLTDHPAGYAAGPQRPGVAYADLSAGLPAWARSAVAGLRRGVDVVLATPHWGPNMVGEPRPSVRRAAAALRDAGATLVAGHSAHVFHGVDDSVLYDLGDFLDDYATDPVLRNDLGLLFLATVDHRGLTRLEAVPLALDYCHTRPARREEFDWIRRRFRSACERLGTRVDVSDGRLVVDVEQHGAPRSER